ncbi:MAG: cadherin-like domain-containing protein [Myxococcales bacterium]|nr:cadherin-like domain-containing protein [Myxococcales bacterium]
MRRSAWLAVLLMGCGGDGFDESNVITPGMLQTEVEPTDDAPEALSANDDSAETAEGEALLLSVVQNDDGEKVKITSVGTPSNGGTAVADGVKRIAYTAPLGFSGMETFDYTVEDDAGATDSATVTVEVIGRPTIVITSPKQGEEVGPDVDVAFEVTGCTVNTNTSGGNWRECHLHVALDGEWLDSRGHYSSDPVPFTGLTTGKHLVELYMVPNQPNEDAEFEPFIIGAANFTVVEPGDTAMP